MAFDDYALYVILIKYYAEVVSYLAPQLTPRDGQIPFIRSLVLGYRPKLRQMHKAYFVLASGSLLYRYMQQALGPDWEFSRRHIACAPGSHVIKNKAFSCHEAFSSIKFIAYSIMSLRWHFISFTIFKFFSALFSLEKANYLASCSHSWRPLLPAYVENSWYHATLPSMTCFTLSKRRLHFTLYATRLICMCFMYLWKSDNSRYNSPPIFSSCLTRIHAYFRTCRGFWPFQKSLSESEASMIFDLCQYGFLI